MSHTADFQTSTWTDPWVLDHLPPLAKLLFVYLWTNSHRELSGLYSISPRTIAYETGIPEADVPDIMNLLYPKVFYDKDKCAVFIVNMVRHQFMRGETLSPTVRTAIRKAVRNNAPRAHPFIAKFCEAYPSIMNIEEYSLGELLDVAPVKKAAPKKKPASETPMDYKTDAQFMAFWADYPRKDSGPKAAYKSWPHPVTPELFTVIMAKLAEFKVSEQWQKPTSIPMATTWLNQRRWEATVIKGDFRAASNALPSTPGKYANVGARVETDG